MNDRNENRYNAQLEQDKLALFLDSLPLGTSSKKAYKSDINHYLLWTQTHSRYDDFFTRDELVRYKKYLLDSDIPINSINRKLSSLRVFGSYLVENGYSYTNHAQNIRNEPIQSAPQEQIPSSYIENIKIIPIEAELTEEISKSNDGRINYLWLSGALLLILVFLVVIISTKSKPTSSPFSGQQYNPNTRLVSFSGILKDSLGNIIAEKTQVRFGIYDQAQNGRQLYSTGPCELIPNLQGSFRITLGQECGSPIREDVLSGSNSYLGITITGDTQMMPRQPLNGSIGAAPTAKTPINSFISDTGDVLLSTEAPSVRSTMESANFALSSAKGLILQSAGNGDITLSATESGQIKFLVGGAQVATIKNTGDIGLTGSIIPAYSGIQTLGTSDKRFQSVYADNVYGSGFGVQGYLRRDVGILTTTNPQDTLALGGDLRIAGETVFGTKNTYLKASAVSLVGNTVNSLAFQTDLFSFDTQNNRIGVGTIAPASKLSIVDSQGTLPVTLIENKDAGVSASGLAVKLGFTGSGNTSNNFITFIKGTGDVVGKIQSNGTSGVTYTSGGGDFAEYFLKDDTIASTALGWEPGSLLCQIADGMVTPCDQNDNLIIGVISKNAAFIGNATGNNDEKHTLVGLVGQLPVKVTTQGGMINSGDALTYSKISGVAQKATTNGRIIGFAQNSYNKESVGIINATIQPGSFSPINNQEVYDPEIKSVPIVKTHKIVPIEKDVTIDLSGPSQSPGEKSELAKLIINGFDNNPVASIDAVGNATFSGTLTSDKVTTETLVAETVQSNEATISGTLTAKKVSSQNITDIENELNKIKNTPLPDPQQYKLPPMDLVSVPNLENLTVTGRSNLYDVAVAGSLMAGTVNIEDNSIMGLGFELRISAISTINLLDGAVIVSRDGNLTTKGELIAQKGIRTNRISALSEKDNIKLSLNEKAETPTKLEVLNNEAQTVASIDASGSAYFAQGIKVNTYLADANDTSAKSVSGAIETNATSAGEGEIPAGSRDITIYNDRLNKDSLVYISPTSNTKNSPLYMSLKKACTKEEVSCKSYFVVTLDEPISVLASFNWWIIN
ncbi:hypothetical protein A3D80_02840 [Candidatus Roizmanbacteria bacterium RIFCSPHIGHO2_02_FULL_40_13b]|uniref:Core-binding (CB) domain-containing protein n=1 Tax=Candidatus Roizmanbacteria bacterium RIFCSPHIGHO2_01_FULL_39_24 TaxID=1802032 RepID=A0A1F7GFD9_9BACT|nr:MAG: hypothetical protein A2799_02790 [Candidatus Roizmanbacteria bacterium RIFCSPHIGHO2_01_FULL_39_24]OGK27130.1 MAG: hypothetical protein A3D80_02840 [Candidatus Roizmanbacteria bacterium RIFCSPHIGHO2_02_FULL_40_13b]OGK49287.1 MAG: hypothetical protein A3A56_00670 [Candidatus Roizmanbacteria bacterium RIFCSPLOWO2_01_FULL_40_32]